MFIKKTLWLSVAAFCLLSGMSFAVAVFVDNFDSYTVGQIDAVTTNWKAFVGATAGLVSIQTDPANPSNKVLGFTEDGNSGGGYGILSGSAIIANGETKTLFYRFRTDASSGTAPNTCIGLTDVDALEANSWSSHCVQVRLNNGATQARNGTLWDPTPGITISANTWYNVWAVVDHATNTWKLYMNSTAGANANPTTDRVGTATPADAFRASNTNALDRFTFLSLAGTPAAVILIDDISVMDGTDLTYPFSSLPVFAANNLLVNGDFEASGSGLFGTNPYPSSWAGWGLNGSQHSDIGYRRDLKGVFLSWNDTGLFQDFAVVAGRAYTISADVITPSSAPINIWTGQISVEWYNELGGQIGSDIVGALTDTDPVDTWKLVKNTFFAPAGTKIGRVVLKLGGSLVPNGLGGYLNSGKAYFDNVSVTGLEPDYNNDGMVKLDDFATASATWLETAEITDLNGDSFFGLEDLVCFAMDWLQPILDYELVWSDEFNGTSVDTNKWVYDVGGGGWGNSQLEYDTNGLNASVSGGNLIIEARMESYGGKSFTSSRMKTKGKFSFQYGTIEIRANIPDLADGLWPALWMMGNSGSWPANGELDIMEMGSAAAIAAGTQNRRTGSTAHWEYGGSHASYGTSYTASSNLTGDFHIWKMDWTPAAITVSLDGTQRWAFDISGGVASDLEEFHHPFYILMNLAVGGTYTGITSVSGITAPFPARMYIDYVRVYKKAK